MSTTKPCESPRTIQSVDRALKIIAILSRHPEGVRLSGLADEVGLRRQTTQSLVRTLQANGWSEQTRRGGVYVLGAAAHEASRLWSGALDRPAAAQPVVNDLCQRIGEYVLLAERRGSHMMHLAEASPSRDLAVSPSAEGSDRLHTMATARVLLAHLEPESLGAVIRKMGFARCGPRTITSRAAFLRELQATRDRGCAICIEEASEDCAAMAVPVRDRQGNVLAGLGVAVPLSRFGEARRKMLLKELRRSAESICQAWRA